MKIYNSILCVLVLPLIIGVYSCGNSGSADKGFSYNVSDTTKGEIIYKKVCIACHLATGLGLPNTFPPLANSDYLVDRTKTIMQVIKGSNGLLKVNNVTYNNIMPPPTLNDEEIAQVLTYVYASWGNNGKPVTVEEVKAARAKN